MKNCVFCKIRDKEIPKEFIYEDRDVMVFPDINPVRPIHLLIVSKKHIPEMLRVDDSKLFSKIFDVAQKMVQQYGLDDKGYRVAINGGGAQAIDHLHIHVFGPMGKGAKM